VCGIAGFVGNALPGDRERLAKMAALMVHRGPDSTGSYTADSCSVAVNRLAVRGGRRADQPLFSEDGSIVACANGEIYNYKELRASLTRSGHSFRTTSDLEVLVHLYEEHGSGLWSRLTGDFAAVIVDNRSGTVLLARDRLGIRPLYVAQVAERLAFCSEIRPLLAVCPGLASPSAAGIALYLQHGFVKAPLTAFAGVYKLNPGTQLVIRDGRLSELRFWNMPGRPDRLDIGGDDAVAQLSRLLGTAVQWQGTAADGPVGISLSGGLDSSVVAALHYARADQPVTAFTVNFPAAEDAPLSEWGAASRLTRRLGIEHVAVDVTAETYRESAARAIDTLEEPIVDPTSALLDRISMAAAARGIRVLLAGEGADELFAGYPQYRRSIAGERAWLGGRRLLKGVSVAAPWPERLRLPGDAPAVLPITSVLGRSDSSIVDVVRSRATTQEPGGAATELLWRYGSADLWGFVSSTLLARGDKMYMANSVEGRYPFLDHHVVEYGLSLPADLKLTDRTDKMVLRSLAADLGIPDSLAPKRSFGLPLAAWLAGPLRDILTEFRCLAVEDQLDLEPQRWLPSLISADGGLMPGIPTVDVWRLYVLLKWADHFL
jgi:asparagine synthase (glutamine-hydrolysing)